MFEGLEVLRILPVILLVIILRGIKFHPWQNLGRDQFLKLPGVSQLLLRHFRDLLFLIASEKNRSAITWTDIGDLTVRLGRINLLPIDMQQLLVRNSGGIVNDLDCLSIICLLGVEALVTVFRFRSASI